MNKPRRLLLLPLVFVSLLGMKTAVRSQSVTPVPAPTIITSVPYTITTPGYYQLGNNLSYNGNGAANDAIITVNANNVTIDLAGHYLSGPTNNAATKLYGVYAYEKSNLLIQNGTLAWCYLGVVVQGNGAASTNALNTRLLNMTMTRCYTGGAVVDFVLNPEITNCRVSATGGGTAFTGYAAALELIGSTGSKVSNNTISDVATPSGGSAYGIYNATYATGNTITNCKTGIYNAAKYQDNLTTGCTTPFTGGTDAGGNN